MDSFKERFDFRYAFENYNKLFVKTTVTELKKAKLEEEYESSKHLFDDNSDRVFRCF